MFYHVPRDFVKARGFPSVDRVNNLFDFLEGEDSIVLRVRRIERGLSD